jgi:hypothetical protein
MIQKNAIVVTLRIGKWTARKFDKRVTDETNSAHGASDDAGRYNKRLASKECLDPFVKLEGETRKYLYKHTIPWGENSQYLLNATMIMEFKQEMFNFQQKYMALVPALLDKWDDILVQAKNDLNGMFNQADYPTRSELEGKFVFKVNYEPVPATDHWGVGMSQEETDYLTKSMEREFETRQQEAVRSIWERIKEQLLHMKDRLTATRTTKTGEEKPGKMYESLFGNMKELVEVLPSINIMNDASINDACNELSVLLTDSDRVRDNWTNDSVRHQKADQVTDVLAKFNQFFS